MHQDASTAVKTFLDETICGSEVLQQIFILHVVDLNKKLFVWADERFIYW